MTELSDDLLVAYVDGQLARDQSRAVKRVLDSDEVSALRVAALKAAHERLELAFDALLSGEFVALTGMQPPGEGEDDGLLPEPAPRPRRRGQLIAATAVVALGLGAAGGYLARDALTLQPWQTEVTIMAPPAEPAAQADKEALPAAAEPKAEQRAEAMPPAKPAPEAAKPATEAAEVVESAAPAAVSVEETAEPAKEAGVASPAPAPAEEPLVTGSLAAAAPAAALRPPSWQDDAERAFSLHGRSALEVGLDSQSNPDFVRFQLAKMLGDAAVLPDLSGEGLAFKRLEILQRDGVPLARILYLPEEGDPVALYARPREPEKDAPMTLHATGDVGMASWTEEHVGYLLAGRLPEDRIMTLAKAVQAQAREAAAAPAPSAGSAPN